MNWDTLPKLTANAPENGWLEYFLVSLFGVKGLFSGAHLLLVSGSSVIFQNASLDLLVKNAWEKFIPYLEVTNNPFKGSRFHHPKKVTD